MISAAGSTSRMPPSGDLQHDQRPPHRAPAPQVARIAQGERHELRMDAEPPIEQRRSLIDLFLEIGHHEVDREGLSVRSLIEANCLSRSSADRTA
jgi:hypothetical protein